MENKTNASNIFWGLALIIIGLAFLLDQFGVLRFGNVIGYAWPLLLLVLGGFVLTRNPKGWGGYILIVLGLIFFIGNFTSFNIWSLWPLILIFIGVASLIGWRGNGGSFNAGSTTSEENKIDDNVVFWGLDKKVTSQNFQGGEVNAIFGGINLDLSEAKLAENAKLEVNAVFGGVEVKVGSNMNVSANGTGVFGGFSNKVSNKPESKEMLNITGSAVFGGVEVK